MSNLLEIRAKMAVTKAKLKAAKEVPLRDSDRNEIMILRTLLLEQHGAEYILLVQKFAAEDAGAPSLNIFHAFQFLHFLNASPPSSSCSSSVSSR